MDIKVNGGTIYGKIEDVSKDVIVIIVAGSGRTDLNGNSSILRGKTDTLLKLSKGLNKAGISTFRYDKRPAGKSVKTFEYLAGIMFYDLVDDLIKIIEAVKKKGYEKIILAGHSQGSLVAMLAAKETQVDGFVSLAGPGENIGEILKKQYGVKPETFKEHIAVVESLMQGKKVEDAVETIPSFNDTNQNFLMSWMKYNPKEEIRNLKFPVLIVQGKKDRQVGEENGKILDDNCPDSKLVYIDDMNHVLKVVRKDLDNKLSYLLPFYRIHPKLIEAVKEYVYGR